MQHGQIITEVIQRQVLAAVSLLFLNPSRVQRHAGSLGVTLARA